MNNDCWHGLDDCIICHKTIDDNMCMFGCCREEPTTKMGLYDSRDRLREVRPMCDEHSEFYSSWKNYKELI